MAKVGKLTKLKSAIKRWPSLTKFSRTTSSISASASTNYSPENNNNNNNKNNNNVVSSNKNVVLHAVYVGKARRRYLVSSEVVDHPLFQELVDKSGSGDNDDGVSVACEVVLFEHLLWMLDNAEVQLGSTDDLVEFYTC